MVSDSISDMLTIIRNANLTNKKQVLIPYSKLKENIAEILVKEGYLKKIPKLQNSKTPNKKIKYLTCGLLYKNGKPVVTEIKRISKPSRRVYVKKDRIPKVLGGMGINIVSTSKGMMTGKQAKKEGLGGELICEIW